MEQTPTQHMDNRLVAAVVAFLLSLGIGTAFALIASYGSVTGFAVVGQAVSFQIMEGYSDVVYDSTNETYYELYDSHQGETKWVELKISNSASAPVNVSVLVSVTEGDPLSVNTSLWNIYKNESLSDPMVIGSNRYEYIYIKHSISPAAEPGNYTFFLDIVPV